MPSNRSKYTVNVLLDPESLPTEDKTVIYDYTNKEFALGTGGSTPANELAVGPLSDYTGLTVGEFQFGMFSRANDNTNTTVSGSAGVSIIAIGDSPGGSVRQNEFRVSGSANGGDDDIKSMGIIMPLRIQNPKPEADSFYFPFESVSTVANYLEHVQIVRVNGTTQGQKSTFMTISLDDVGNYIGSGSYSADVNGVGRPTVSGSYNYVKMEHVAHTVYGSNRRAQKCTHHFIWYKDDASPYRAEDLRCTSVEDIRSPDGRVIIDPFRTTGSFNADGDLVLSIYHYDVDYVQHTIKYTLI